MRLTFTLAVLLSGSALLLAHPGIGIVMDSQGNVFYTDLVHVWKIAHDGTRSIAVPDVHTHELYIDSSDNLYGEHEWYEGEATDKWGKYVWCLGHDGVLEKTVPDVEGFLDDNTLVRDPQGNSYWPKKVEGHEVLMRTTNGQEAQVCDDQFQDIRWLHYSKDADALLVVDQLSVKRVSPSGQVSVLAENLKERSKPFEKVGDRHYVFGTWTDRSANTYVAVYGASKVLRIDQEGNQSTVFSSPLGWSPCGGMVDPNGNLWIMEFSFRNNTRVRKIGKDGEETVFGG